MSKQMTSFVESYVARDGQSGAYSQQFVAAVEQCGAWSHEARLVMALAATQAITLDENRLILSDIHDLQALEVSLASGLPRELGL